MNEAAQMFENADGTIRRVQSQFVLPFFGTLPLSGQPPSYARFIIRVYLVVHSPCPRSPRPWPSRCSITRRAGCGRRRRFTGRFLRLTPITTMRGTCWGSSRVEAGKYQAGVECIQRALAFRPDWAEAHFNLGNAWKDQGKLDEAMACYQRAVQMKTRLRRGAQQPGACLAGAWGSGRSRGVLSANAATETWLRRAHNNLGNVFSDQGKPDEAVACYQRALQLKPDYADAHNNLGNVFKDQGKPDEAVACYQRALQLKPDFAEVHNNLGNVFRIRASRTKPRHVISERCN